MASGSKVDSRNQSIQNTLSEPVQEEIEQQLNRRSARKRTASQAPTQVSKKLKSTAATSKKPAAISQKDNPAKQPTATKKPQSTKKASTTSKTPTTTKQQAKQKNTKTAQTKGKGKNKVTTSGTQSAQPASSTIETPIVLIEFGEPPGTITLTSNGKDYSYTPVSHQFLDSEAREYFSWFVKKNVISDRGLDVEFGAVYNTLKNWKWDNLLTNPIEDASITLVQEFYCNARSGTPDLPDYIYCRGQFINFSPAAINNFLGIDQISDSQDGYKLWEKEAIKDYQPFQAELRLDRKPWMHFQLNYPHGPKKLQSFGSTKLRTNSHSGVHSWITHSIIPSGNQSHVNFEKALVNFCIHQELRFDIGKILHASFWKMVKDNQANAQIGFPFLITQMCAAHNAVINTDIDIFREPKTAVKPPPPPVIRQSFQAMAPPPTTSPSTSQHGANTSIPPILDTALSSLSQKELLLRLLARSDYIMTCLSAIMQKFNIPQPQCSSSTTIPSTTMVSPHLPIIPPIPQEAVAHADEIVQDPQGVQVVSSSRSSIEVNAVTQIVADQSPGSSSGRDGAAVERDEQEVSSEATQ